MLAGQKAGSDRSLVALLVAQALSSFNHSMLRSALLTLVSFRGLAAFGLGPEATIAVSTLVIVLPYIFLSLPAGRMADRFARARVVRATMALDIVVLALGAAALGMGDGALLLVAMLLGGIQAALLGPAKYAILPDLSKPGALISSNGWMSASNTLAILLGMVLGNILVLDAAGFRALIVGGVVLAGIGCALSLVIKGEAAKDATLPLGPATLLADYRALAAKLRDTPLIVWPMIGSCWFWFQGTIWAALMPLYVAQAGQPAHHVSFMLLASSAGVALGALCASRLVGRFQPLPLALALIPLIVLPGFDFWLMSIVPGAQATPRAAFDLFILSAGSGFYLVPLSAAIQRLTPAQERARFIGISHTLSGLSMCAAGLAILFYPAAGLSVTDIYLLVALSTGVVAAFCLFQTLGSFRRAAISHLAL
ncbi:MFS transporter [Devosia sp.]|uniref:MFS transporter n=1 Tax=Devosia sp. TaxID=1871048 RepID=UPI002FCC991C